VTRIGAAVVGLGVGLRHAEAYRDLDSADLVALCDLNPTRLEPAAREFGCRAYPTIDGVLADHDIQLVSIATPHPSHAQLAIQALRAGRHVLVEKPMTLDVRQADQMIAAAREAGRTLAVIFQRRWWPAVQAARRAIEDGRIGRPILGQCTLTWWRSRAYYVRDAWRGRWDTEGGGVLVNQGIHAIDMFQWLMDAEVEEVVGRWSNLTHPFIEVEDTAAAILRFRGGALGVIAASTSVRASQNRFHIHGSLGHSVGVVEEPEGAVGYNDLWTIPGEEDVPRRSLAEHVARGEYIYRSGRYAAGPVDPAESQCWPTAYTFREAARPSYHARQIADVISAIQDGRRPLVDGVEGRKSVAILQAIYESQRTGQPVRPAQAAAV
jgi:predicted dehydrogenase